MTLIFTLALGILVAPLPVGAQQPQKLTPAPVVAKKFKASAYNLALEGYYLIVDAGTDRGIFASNGLDPEWVTTKGRAITATDLKDLIRQGTKIGMSSPSEIFLARAQDLPVKIVAGYVGDTLVKVYAKADGPVKTAKDLDGRKIGPTSAAVQRHIAYISHALGIKAEAVPFTNLDNNIAALREGRIDAIITAEARVLTLVDAGELRIVLRGTNYTPNPQLNNAVWATDDLIQQNPDLVKRFVKATLETVKYLKENPSYAAQLMTKRTNVARDLANKVVSLIDWTPSGQPGGNLIAASTNYWQFLKDTGAVRAGTDLKIGEVVDTRFLH